MYKLLVVDDEFEIRNGLCRFFPWNAIGFDVVGQAENGKSALEFAKTNPLDVILCDIAMPVMTGLELARELNTLKCMSRIIFLSGYKDFEYAQKALEYGAKNYILKSTNYDELIRVFSKIKSELDEEQAANATNKKKRQPVRTEMNFNEKIISTIKSYVETHYREVTLEDLTNQVHMNPDYISKFFKQKTGQNFSEYLLEIRMKKAAELLDDIQYKTYEISDMVGYSNSFNFTRTFKSYYGMNPREYRNRKSNKQDQL
ncbi:response regulator transcription factor [Cohnella cellulosilytica]|uniref:Response regulator n=1 Tax=Cohnella cellulosilytica TaxID=986710 RepID=A0ABW2F8W2_9BACL